MAEQKQPEAQESTPSVFGPASFRLTYFAFGGRAQPLRAAAFLGGIRYRDRFISFTDLARFKEEGKMRWSGVPEITLFDKDGNETMTVGQSNMCLKLIGSMGGLYPGEYFKAEQIVVEEIMCAVEDVFGICIPAYVKQMEMNDESKTEDERKKAAEDAKTMCEGYMKEKLPYWFGKFEARLTENEAAGNKNGYFVGDTLTVADLKFYYMVTFLNGKDSMPYIQMEKILESEDYPKVIAHFKAFEEKLKPFEDAWAVRLKRYGEGCGEVIVNEEGKCVYLPM